MNDSNIHVAPCEGFSPLNFFKDAQCEELCFPTLFFGEARKYHEYGMKHYQEIAK